MIHQTPEARHAGRGSCWRYFTRTASGLVPMIVAGALLSWMLAACQGSNSSPETGGPVVVAAFDGLGNYMLREDPAAEHLSVVQESAEAGAFANGMLPAFPGNTTNSHAALYTGQYGNVNGITAGNVQLPRSEHTIFDHISGFHSSLLRSEPIWVTAAREGKRVLAIQSTQNYPFLDHVTAPDAPVPPVLVSGYGPPMLSPPRLLAADSLEPISSLPDDLEAPDSLLPLRLYTWESGPFTFYAAAVAENESAGYSSLYVTSRNSDAWVRVLPRPEETTPPAGRELARHFSDDLLLRDASGQVVSATNFRLYRLSEDGRELTLFQPPLHEVALYDGSGEEAALVQDLYREAGGFIANGPSYLWRDGELGLQFYAGGDGTAEIRYLEGVELLVRQANRYTQWFVRRYDPDLLLAYSPYPDETDHWFYGFTRTEITGADPAVAETYQSFRNWSYMALNQRARLLEEVAGQAGHIIYVSDHGMTAAHKEVHVNEILRERGFLHVGSDGSPDPARTRAYHISGSSGVMINSSDWRDGIVPPEEVPELRADIMGVLGSITDPETGDPVFARFFESEEHDERLGTGGPANPDLFYQLAPGYTSSHLLGQESAIENLEVPIGSHSHPSVHEEIKSVFIARGPRVSASEEPALVRAVDIFPLVCDLLGITPPDDLAGEDLNLLRR